MCSGGKEGKGIGGERGSREGTTTCVLDFYQALPTLTILFRPSQSHILEAALTWRPIATSNETALGFFCSSDSKPQKMLSWKCYRVGRLHHSAARATGQKSLFCLAYGHASHLNLNSIQRASMDAGVKDIYRYLVAKLTV